MGNCIAGIVSLPGNAATTKASFKVCICGGAGNLGQPLCMLAALDPLVAEVAVFDRSKSMFPPAGVACDLDQLDRPCRVKAYSSSSVGEGIECLEECFTGCHLVLACIGVPVEGKSEKELLDSNGSLAKSIVEGCARFCPRATVGLIVTPVNAVVPAMATLYERSGLDPTRICGITGLDGIRATKLVQEETGSPFHNCSVPVIGGHAGYLTGSTAVPLFSQCPAAAKISESKRSDMTRRVQNLVVNNAVPVTVPPSTSTMAHAYAAWRFGNAVLSGLSGTKAEETCFMRSSICNGVDYFSSRVTFGPFGVEFVHPLGKMSASEVSMLEKTKIPLQESIASGVEFASRVHRI